MKYFAILGRQPKIGLAELESLLGSDNITPFGYSCALVEASLSPPVYNRLGSVIKVGEVLLVDNYDGWPKVAKKIISYFKQIANTKDAGKLTIGISTYGLRITNKDIEKTGLTAKKILKASSRPIRLVPNKAAALSTAQVIHNNLTGPSGIEIVVIGHGNQVIVGVTTFEQDIEAYTARDQARPKRDAYIGMLPPKLAQTIINLAQGSLPQNSLPATPNITLLDPFCGTGVVLQEASLMGYSVIGTDVNPKMVDYSIENIQWLLNKYPTAAKKYTSIELADAQDHQWPPNIGLVATETFLGQPISMMPDDEKLARLTNETNGLHKKTLVNLAKQLPPGTRLCLAVPTWRTKKGFKHLPALDQLEEIGYNRIDFKHTKRQELIYIRDNQFVGRELVVLTRK
jgi:tRNA G10  N-methylase Trm11